MKPKWTHEKGKESRDIYHHLLEREQDKLEKEEMSGVHSNLPNLAELEILKTYVYYDQPLIYSCKDKAEQIYLVLFWAEEEAFTSQTWLYLPVSETRMKVLEANEIDLYCAYSQPETKLYRVIVFNGKDEPDIHVFDPATLTDNDLSGREFFLCD